MKKLVALLLALVMVLSLSAVAFAADGPKSLFDPELIGKDPGGFGKPVFLGKAGSQGDSALASALGQFAANSVAALLYQPAQYLAGVIAAGGSKLERDINRAAPAVSFAAKTMVAQLTLAVDTVEYVSKGIVYMGTALYKLLDEDAGASEIYETIERICLTLQRDVENAAGIIENAMKTTIAADYSGTVMGGSIHRAVETVTDWLLEKDNFRSYEQGGDIATYIFEELFGLDSLYN